MQRFLTRLDNSIEWTMATVESMALAVLSRLATWAAPVPSAVVVSRSAADTLGLSFGYALCIAIALEVVGIAAVHQWLAAREWNATKRIREPEASEAAGRAATVAYVLIAELMIVAFELKAVTQSGNPWGLTAIPLPLLTFLIVLIANERMMMHERRKAREAARVAVASNARVAIARRRGCSNASPSRYPEFADRAREGERLSAGEIMAEYGIPQRTAYSWIERWRNNGGSHEVR